MFSISQLTAIAGTAIALGILIIAGGLMITGGTFTSVAVHKKRVARTNGKQKSKKAKVNEKIKKVEKTKTNTKTKQAKQTKTVTTEKTKQQTVQPTQKIQPTIVNDKSDLIGEKNVTVNDLKADSKYNWAYSIKLISDTKPENNITLSWKTNDRHSVIESLVDDTRLGSFGIMNNEITSINIDAKYQNEKGQPENLHKEYASNGDMLSIKQFKSDVKTMLEKMSIEKVKEEEHVM